MIDLSGADLNRLVSLDALIEEANVTKAAGAPLHIPRAMSHRSTHLVGDVAAGGKVDPRPAAGVGLVAGERNTVRKAQDHS